LILSCVGRDAKSPEQLLCDLYLERAKALGRRLGFTAIALAAVDTSRAATAPARMREETVRLTRKLSSGAHRIALTEKGRFRTSEDFARHLAALRDRAAGDIVFLIGGPDGLDAELGDNAEERMGFGPQTWPHLLVRVMLAEQIYRAMTILARHPYHRA
jgi:23S rRNA (pseudouridine1915-N3)-methyltransferase